MKPSRKELESILGRGVTGEQFERLVRFQTAAQELNKRINLYSDVSADEFWLRHVVHSLFLATKPFPGGARVVDWGAGGGLPSIPLAIVNPEVTFDLVDAVEKKTRAVRTIARRIGLQNVRVHHARAERWEGDVTHSVSRATAPLKELWSWHRRVATHHTSEEAAWPPGLLCLKGGDLSEELSAFRQVYTEASVSTIDLSTLSSHVAFMEKVIVEVNDR